MPVPQGSLELLDDPIAKELLQSTIPARLAYIGMDGSPRVIPIWFHWNGREIVMGTPPKAPKLRALAKRPKVSLTIDNNEFPHKVLLIRGTARLDSVNDLVPEYVLAAERRAKRGSSNCVESFRPWCESRSRPNGSAFWTFRPDFQALWQANSLKSQRCAYIQIF